MKIVLCFFGITRSLRFTHSSIVKNIIEPAKQSADLKIVAHYFDQDKIENPRSAEFGNLNKKELEIIKYDNLIFEKPQACLEFWDFASIKNFGDHWHDEFKSLSNLIHQLHSLNEVTKAALSLDPDCILFCRPDLEYHDSFETIISAALNDLNDQVYLPNWQNWYGYNDRFAICTGAKTAQIYGQRAQKMSWHLNHRQIPLQGERFLKDVLVSAGITVNRIDLRASRVRSDGRIVKEDFSPSYFSELKTMVPSGLKKIIPESLKSYARRDPN